MGAANYPAAVGPSSEVEITGVATDDGHHGFVGSVAEDPANARVRAARDATTDEPFRVLVDALPVAVAYAAPAGALEFANRRWRELTGAGTGAALATVFTDPRDEAAVADALRAGAPWSGVARVDGGAVGVVLVPVASELGGGGVLTLTEPTVASGSSVPADAPVAAFAALLDASLDYAAIIERDGPLRYLNPAARELFGIADDADVAHIVLAELVEFHDGGASEFVESARVYDHAGADRRRRCAPRHGVRRP